MKTRGAWRFALLLLACVVLHAAPAGAQPPGFTPRDGFAGESEGTGSLRFLLGSPRPFRVSSHGHEQRDGTLRLEQTVTFEGKPPRDRTWVIATTHPNRYSATLSDAAGPVTGVTDGPVLSLRYRIKGPLVMHQQLQRAPDGKTIVNVGVITLLGVPVGRLHETITRR